MSRGDCTLVVRRLGRFWGWTLRRGIESLGVGGFGSERAAREDGRRAAALRGWEIRKER